MKSLNKGRSSHTARPIGAVPQVTQNRSKRPDLSEIEVIVPNFKRRLSGVTATIARLVPIQAERIPLATLGPGLPDGFPGFEFRGARADAEAACGWWAARLACAAQYGNDRRSGGEIPAAQASEAGLYLSIAEEADMADPLADPSDGRRDRYFGTHRGISAAPLNSHFAWHRRGAFLYRSRKTERDALRRDLGLPEAGRLVACYGADPRAEGN